MGGSITEAQVAADAKLISGGQIVAKMLKQEGINKHSWGGLDLP
jgi:hypothetical protein